MAVPVRCSVAGGALRVRSLVDGLSPTVYGRLRVWRDAGWRNPEGNRSADRGERDEHRAVLCQTQYA